MYVALNNAYSTLAAGIAAGDLVITVQTGHGTRFAVGTNHSYIALENASGDLEICKLTGQSGDNLTVVRAQDGTTARSWNSGDIIECRPCAAAIVDIRADSMIHAAGAKATPADADEFGFLDSTASFAMVKATAAQIKAWLWAAWGALINGGTSKATPVDGDALAVMDSANSNATVKVLLSNLKAYILNGGTLTGLLKFKAGANVASAATVDLTAATGNTVHITGTTGISAWTMTAGQVMDVIFDGVLTLTHHAINNNLPGGANITTAANDRARLFYDGTTVIVLNYSKADGTAVGSSAGGGALGFANLNASAPGNSAVITITADEITTGDGAGGYLTTRSWNKTITMTSSGAGGLDTGTVAANTEYHRYAITKDDGTQAVIASLSATSPLLPAGYTKWKRVGAFFTDGTANKYPLRFKQNGMRVVYQPAGGTNVTSYREMANGTLGTYPATYAAISVTGYVPSTAAEIEVDAYQTVNSAFGVAPNNSFSNVDSGSNPPPLSVSGGSYQHATGTMTLESTNIYAVSGSTCVVRCVGWIENL